MNLDLQSFLDVSRSVNIAGSFARFVARGLDVLSARRRGPREFDSPAGLSEAYFGGWSAYESAVRLPGRLSRYCPTYFPVAYSPQANVAFENSAGGVQVSTYRNPAPVATNLRMVDGGYLAFLFAADATAAPHITSPYHLDRMATIGPDGSMSGVLPYSLAEGSVPVLISADQIPLLDERVAVVGKLRPLPTIIDEEIAASQVDFVRLYYHAFFRADSFPDHGFILDARSDSGGTVTRVGGPSSFGANVLVELSFESKLDGVEYESVLTEALKRLDPHPAMNGTGHRYRPAYYVESGYEVIQLSRSPLLVHLAPSRQVLSFSMLLDTTGHLQTVTSWYVPAIGRVLDSMREADPSHGVTELFKSDSHFAVT